MFYEKIWEYEGFGLVSRPDTQNLYITWCKPGTRRYRRKSTGTSDLTLARRRLVEFANARSRPASTEPEDVKVMGCLVTYCQRNIASRKHPHAERTALKWWGEFLEAEDILTVADLTLDMQEAFIDWRRSRGTSPRGQISNGTVNRDLGIMRAALRDAWKRGRLKTVPHVMMLAKPPPRQRVLSTDEIQRLLSTCEHEHLKMYLMLALHTLQRPGAICELTVDRVDLVAGRIDFNEPDRPITNKRRPVLPITSVLRPYLEDAIRHSVSGHIIEWDGKPVITVKKAFESLCKKVGIEGACLYTLRHTGATLLAAAGVPMRQISGMLGHTSTQTTEYHYAKHKPEYLSEASNALNSLFTEPKRLTGPERTEQSPTY